MLPGSPPEHVLKRDAMAKAGCIDWFVAFAERRKSAF